MIGTKKTSYKVVILGDSQVGKTTLLYHQLQQHRSQHHVATIGCQCHDVEVDVGNSKATLQVWDTAGQEIYKSLVPIYLRESVAAIVVFDITEKSSFGSLSDWLHILFGILPEESPVFFVANKNDREESRQVDDDMGRAFAEKHGGRFFRTSAKTGEGINDLFKAVASTVLEMDIQNKSANVIQPQEITKKKCCYWIYWLAAGASSSSSSPPLVSIPAVSYISYSWMRSVILERASSNSTVSRPSFTYQWMKARRAYIFWN